MTPRTYSLAALSVAFGLFGAVAGLNLLVDPEAVLGTGVLGQPLNFNDRYLLMADYEADPDRYDAVLFGASRGNVIPRDALSRRFGANVANFSVIGGQIVDHVAVLEHLLRTRAARGRPLRAVFLLLDVDLLGERPNANRTIQSQWHPVLTGESMGRFKWRYVTAIQPKAWWGEIRRAVDRASATPAMPGANKDGSANGATRIANTPTASDATPPAAPVRRETITARDDFARQIALIERFVTLCRTHGVRLVVAFSPLRVDNAAQFDAADIEAAIARVAAIVPVWDFGAPPWLSRRPDLWLDPGHYAPAVGRMMLDRIFGPEEIDTSERPPAEFGVLRPR